MLGGQAGVTVALNNPERSPKSACRGGSNPSFMVNSKGMARAYHQTDASSPHTLMMLTNNIETNIEPIR
jgi:hypothetical protein